MRRILALGFFVACLCHAASAQQPDRDLTTEYTHRSWGQRDGAPRGIQGITQTPDGFLWLGASDGLFRFDGVSFERYEPESGPSLPAGNVQSLMALPNGDLWVGYHSGAIARVRNGKADTWPGSVGAASGNVVCLTQDKDGTIWAGGTGGLRRFVQNRWEDIGSEWHLPGKSVRAMYVDRSGTLWASTEDTITFLPKEARVFQPTSIPVNTVYSIAESPQGKLWMADVAGAVRPIPLGNSAKPSDQSAIHLWPVRILFDTEGSLWIATVGDGLRRLTASEYQQENENRPGTAFEGFTVADGMTNGRITAIFQDRDGNIWAGTPSGLDRFQKKLFQTVQLRLEYDDPIVAAGDASNVWAFNRGYAFHIAGQEVQTSWGPDPGQIDFVFRDAAGVLWAVSNKNVMRFDHDQWSILFPIPEELGASSWRGTTYIAKDRSGVLWLAAEREGLFRRENDSWQRFDTPGELMRATPQAAYTDDAGRVWFGFAGGFLIYLENGRLHRVASSQTFSGTDVYSLDGHDGTVWIGEGLGLAFFDGHTLHTVTPADQPSFGRVLEVKQAIDGSLWLDQFSGLIRIGPEEVRKLLATPSYRVHYEIFDSPSEIIRSGGQKIAEEIDGRLWFSGGDRVSWIDPKSVPKQPSFPLAIRSFSADGSQYPSRDDPALPPRPRRIEIDYAGLNLSDPEHVRYRYKLDGTDKDWQDAGTHREAFYTDLGPGTHRFEVGARYEGGEWEPAGAVLEFSIAPAWYQTLWFRSLCVAAIFLIVWVLYRMRVRQVAKAMSVRFDERLSERTRLARDLHDTLLQTIQGGKYVADSALRIADSTNPMRGPVEQLSVWLGQAIEEGRAALNSLRTSTTETNDLADAFRRAIDGCRGQSSMECSFSVLGQVTEMHPIVRDEVYRVGYEAIRNACMHSQATHLSVELTYAEDLILRVQDNGTGIDAAIAGGGREGHFGLQGMRERADRIMAKLTIETSAALGTEMKLVVPGSIIYRMTIHGGRKVSTVWSLLEKMGLTSDSTDF